MFNFSGWMLICGLGAATILLGRWWHRRSGYGRTVGILYPVPVTVAALGLVVCPPLSRFLLWLEPIFPRGGAGEWVMLGFWLAAPAAFLAAFWRGRMRERFAARDNIPVLFTLLGLPLFTLVSTLAHGMTAVLAARLPRGGTRERRPVPAL